MENSIAHFVLYTMMLLGTFFEISENIYLEAYKFDFIQRPMFKSLWKVRIFLQSDNTRKLKNVLLSLYDLLKLNLLLSIEFYMMRLVTFDDILQKRNFVAMTFNFICMTFDI